MTPEQAEKIAALVIGLLANRPTTAVLRRSQLKGHSLLEVSRAFSIVIARRRQIALGDATMYKDCFEYAEKAGGLVAGLPSPISFVPDELADRLEQIPCESGPVNLARMRVINDYMAIHSEADDREAQSFLKEESLASFNEYCWSLDADDPLYWRRIYTHLDPKYSERFSLERAIEDINAAFYRAKKEAPRWLKLVLATVHVTFFFFMLVTWLAVVIISGLLFVWGLMGLLGVLHIVKP